MLRNYIGFFCFPKTENKPILSKQRKNFLNLKAFFGKDKMYPNKRIRKKKKHFKHLKRKIRNFFLQNTRLELNLDYK